MQPKKHIERVPLSIPKLTYKRVWYGVYGGHYSVIVFFKNKPILSKEDFPGSMDCKWYDCLENKNKIIGAISLYEFIGLYPCMAHIEASAIEITTVDQIYLQAAWNKYGDMSTIFRRIDW